MDNQSNLERSFKKKMSVDVINLLALYDKNKDIINVMKSSLYINFDQTVTT
jgi:hypothetical protein